MCYAVNSCPKQANIRINQVKPSLQSPLILEEDGAQAIFSSMSCRIIPTSPSSSAFISGTFYTHSHVAFSPELRNVAVTLGQPIQLPMETNTKDRGWTCLSQNHPSDQQDKFLQIPSETSNHSKTHLRLHIYKWKDPASLVKLFWLRLVLAPAL